MVFFSFSKAIPLTTLRMDCEFVLLVTLVNKEAGAHGPDGRYLKAVGKMDSKVDLELGVNNLSSRAEGMQLLFGSKKCWRSINCKLLHLPSTKTGSIKNQARKWINLSF